MKIIEWNINQRANHSKEDKIPEFVAEEINELSADIVIITEFYKVSQWKNFVISLASYNTFVTDNPKNEVLIAIKKKYLIESVYWWTSSYNKCMPDYLEVNIKHNENIISVIGARILVDYYNYNNKKEVTKEMKNRYVQNSNILERIKKLQEKGNLILGAGDFNTGRRNNPNENWSSDVLKSELLSLDIALHTPKGNSHQLYKGDDYAGCPDHLFASSALSVETVPYYWNFVECDKNIYFEGKYTKDISAPYPDHGILIAEIKKIN